MKIMFFTSVLTGGGAERQLIQLAEGLAQRDHDVHVVTFRGTPSVSLLSERVAVTSLGKGGRGDVARFLARLFRVAATFEPDVIHGFLPLPNTLATLVAPFVSRSKVVWGIRASRLDLAGHEWGSRVVFQGSRLLATAADLVIANSEAGVRYLTAAGYPRDRLVVVPNGIDTDRFRPDPSARSRQRSQWGLLDEEIVVGLVGRVTPAKDHDTFLRAVAQARTVLPRLRAVCIGGADTPERRALAAAGVSLGLADVVTWVDAVSEMRSAYAGLDLLCLSSVTEGFPNVVGEAMACGVPCVVTDAGDARSIVGDLGVTAPIGDAGALAQGIVEMYWRWHDADRAPLRNRICDLFPVARMVERTEAYLMDLVER